MDDRALQPRSYQNKSIRDWIDEKWSASNHSGVNALWFNFPDDFMRRASIAVVITVSTGNSSRAEPEVHEIHFCVIDARWFAGTVSSDACSTVEAIKGDRRPPGREWIIQSPADQLDGWPFDSGNPNSTRIEPSFAQHLDARVLIEARNSSVIEQLSESAGLLADIPDGPNRTDLNGPDGPAPGFESILAMLAVNGIARTAPDARIVGELIDYTNGSWWEEFMPHEGAVSGGEGLPSTFQPAIRNMR